MDRFILVLTTVPEEKRAQEIARALVGERLAACVTVSSACQSLYWWEDRVTEDREYVLSIKTKASLYARLEKKLKELHPYEVPEIIALPIQKGSRAYLDWLKKETAI
ncbi:MAG: divalent-cation tolerance protein CutA [Clostridiales bacterium]|nr:divalent-cation tolerance protein CutA [Clostridiales bacterium]